MLKTIIVGYIGQDAQTRTFQDGSTATNFSVADTQSYTDKGTGERKEFTTWLNCTIWNPSGVKEYLKKGTLVYVEGYPSTRTYEKQDKSTGISFDLNVHKVELLTSAKEKHEQAAPAAVVEEASPQG